MRGELIPIGELADRDREAWAELAGAALEPNPFFDPRFVLPAAETLEPDGLALLAVRDGSELAACLPVRRIRGWRRVPFTATVGWRHLYSFLGTPLIHRDRAGGAVASILDHLDRGDSALMALELMGRDGPVFAALSEEISARGLRPLEPLRFQRAALERRPDGAYLDVSTKHRREWNRQRRRLSAEAGGDVETRDRSGEEGALEDFLRLEASGWKGEAGTAFARLPGHGELFKRICRGFREAGRLQLLSLEAAGRPLAMKCNLIANEGIFCFKIGFDASLAKYSPGMQLELDNIANFDQRTDARWMDSCAGRGNAMINRLWPDRREITALVVPARGIRGRIAHVGIGAASALRGRGGPH